jgi:hypothetical protein
MQNENWLKQAQSWKDTAQKYPSPQIKIDACDHAQFCLEQAEHAGEIDAIEFDTVIAELDEIREGARNDQS